MKTFQQPGHVLTLTAPYTRTSGQGAQVGSIFGVATADVTSGDDGEFLIEGVVELAKTSAQAWTQGQKVYWDNGNKRADSDPEIGMLIGVATEAAANPSTTGIVRLNGGAPATSEGPQDAIADLTDSTTGAATDGTVGAVTDLATAGGNTYSDAAVNAKFDLCNDAHKELTVKINAILAALRSAGIIAT